MKSDACRQYLEDPELHAGHLAECSECRALFSDLDSAPPHQPLGVGELPLAPWEGAGYRAWPLVIGGALTVIVIAAGLFSAGGTSPAGMLRAVSAGMPSLDVVFSAFRLIAGALQNAPRTWQIGIGLSFIVVNGLFFALLRRTPRGLDV